MSQRRNPHVRSKWKVSYLRRYHYKEDRTRQEEPRTATKAHRRGKYIARGESKPDGFSNKKSKYGNIKVKLDGYTFDSKREAEYYVALRASVEVVSISVHPRYELTPKFTNADGVKRRAMHYVADFLVTYKDGTEKVVDVKGVETPVFKMKRILFELKYGKVITIVK